MTPEKKYGDEFLFHRFTVPHREGHNVTCREVVVCIRPKEDAEITLEFGWSIVRELAEWLTESFATIPDEEPYRIILAWSRSVRPQQGHIFKLWGYKDRIRRIAGCPTFFDYVKATGDNWTPMPNWQKDVFEKGV